MGSNDNDAGALFQLLTILGYKVAIRIQRGAIRIYILLGVCNQSVTRFPSEINFYGSRGFYLCFEPFPSFIKQKEGLCYFIICNQTRPENGRAKRLEDEWWFSGRPLATNHLPIEQQSFWWTYRVLWARPNGHLITPITHYLCWCESHSKWVKGEGRRADDDEDEEAPFRFTTELDNTQQNYSSLGLDVCRQRLFRVVLEFNCPRASPMTTTTTIRRNVGLDNHRTDDDGWW